MIHVSATEAKTHFGKLLDTARREYVVIEKQGRSVAVILSQEEFERLSEIEDRLWSLEAETTKSVGLLTEEKKEKLLDEPDAYNNSEMAREAVTRLRALAREMHLGQFNWDEWKSYRDIGRA